MYDIKKIEILIKKIEELNNLQKLKYEIKEIKADGLYYLDAKNEDNYILFTSVYKDINKLYCYLTGLIDGINTYKQYGGVK